MSKKLWVPSEDRIKNSNMVRYLEYLKDNFALNFTKYAEVYNWSINNREAFWKTMWDFNKIIHSKPPASILENPSDMLNSKWFTGARLNFAENLLRFRDNHPAIIFQAENPKSISRSISYKVLYDDVSNLAHSLKNEGVTVGDRVASFTPNIPETIIAMLASTSLGATWSSCSADLGIKNLINRFSQIKPKILFMSDSYSNAGKTSDLLSFVDVIKKEIKSIKKIIIVPYLNKPLNINGFKDRAEYNSFISHKAVPVLKFEQLPFDHPIYIVYTSGTTGPPKSVVHGAGGTLLQHLKELVLHTDLKREDKLYYTTTPGWVLWNWMTSSLAAGSTLVLRDGSPFYPESDSLFKFIEENEISLFGTSARYLTSVLRLGLKPKEKFNLSKLRAVMYGGSALSAEGYEYIYNSINKDVMVSSMAGGTEILSCFAIGNPLDSVFAGEIQGWGLGMKCNVFDNLGIPIKMKKGELVCTSSFPSQPIYFWNDPEKKKYKEAYFNFFPNIWRHGDFAEITENNQVIIYGRSDATLNPGGVRIGTAEIYTQLEGLDEILDCLAVGQKWNNDERIILFVKLKENLELTPELIKKIKRRLIDNCGANYVPTKIISVKDIPYTINGKKMELTVKKIINGEEVKYNENLSNPESLDIYKNIQELKS